MLQRLGRLIVDFWIVIAFGIVAGLLLPPAHAGEELRAAVGAPSPTQMGLRPRI